ncbi:TolC family protein [Acidiluteibacter ferrifornacis]|uniref:TolC family protein n=1 Tax=Acidiluteibacter ferrifornacis TaxID=2692424 RepID=A0A6N9NJM1_9FLAO|nr:TolC family protein [Acidiluteibacter ferrifornacis]NBG65681.1 TolC family protein [Acidiluteibacter ferrifornacis]
MKSSNFLIALLLTGFTLQVSSQELTGKVMSFDQFMEIVKTHHPIAKQANLKIQVGEATMQQARGGFDPKLFNDVSQKYFNDKNYYSLIDAGVKIPTWFGIEVKGGYEQNKGNYLNPENNTPSNGLWYAGISLPVGAGLFIDERRAELRKAQLFQEMNTAERQLMVNELLFESGKAYWDWFEAYNIYRVYQEAVALANVRYQGVKQNALLGDQPAMDTVEAGIQMQNRQLALRQSKLDYDNAAAHLMVFLWADGTIPLELENGTQPEVNENILGKGVDPYYFAQRDTLLIKHPKLKQFQLKMEQIAIDQRLKREQLKPTLNLKYNALSEAINSTPFEEYNANNYNWGLEFSMPILLRKERGALRLAEYKMQEAELEYGNQTAEVLYKINSALNEWEATKDQLDIYTQTVLDYNRLLNGERQLFNAGESSLFMVNSREVGFISAQIKQIEILAKNHKARLKTTYSFGLLGEQ